MTRRRRPRSARPLGGRGVLNEVINRIVLTLTDSSGESQDVTWSDPNNDGNPTVEDIVLKVDETYDVQVYFWNDLSEPSEEITPEIADESDEHQVFITTPNFINVEILDTDVNGLDLGLEQQWTTTATGSDVLTLGLRHMPEEDGSPVKTEDMDIDSLPGEWDVNIDYPVIVE